jgi:hypothetical protein
LTVLPLNFSGVASSNPVSFKMPYAISPPSNFPQVMIFSSSVALPLTTP